MAIAECERRADQVRVVLSDVVMPDVSGPEVLRAVRPLCSRASFVLMSGYPLSEHPEDLVADDEFSWLQKPFEVAQLVEAVTAALQENQKVN